MLKKDINNISKADLKELIEFTGQTCVSIYMPSVNAQQNFIKFKNLFNEAKQHMTRINPSAEIFKEAEEKYLNEDFWASSSDGNKGLALFCSEGFCKLYQLPIEVEERVQINNHFYVNPLIPAFTNDTKFYLLSLSQKKTTFYEGRKGYLKAIVVPNMPVSKGEALKHDDDPVQGLNFHQSMPGAQAPMFHGNNAGSEDDKEEIKRFFQQVDKALHEILKEEKAPLILAGVEYLQPIYRSVSSYKHILPEGLTGNYDANKPNHEEQLLEHSWTIIEKILQKNLEQNLEVFFNGSGVGKSSDKIQEVISAAFYGKVDTLFVPKNAQVWGNFHPESNQLELRNSAEENTEDLLDLTASETLKHGGNVYVIESEKMPNNSNMAAIFRY